MADKIFKYKVVVEAVDKPLKSMKDTLDSIKNSLLNVNKEVTSVKSSVEKFANTFKLFEGAKAAIGGLKMAFSSLTTVIQGAFGAAKDFGEYALEKIMFRQKSVYSLGKYYGNGKEALNQIIAIAGNTTMDTEPMVAMAQQLAPSVKRFEDLKKLMLLAGDINAQMGSNELNDQVIATLVKTTSGAMPEAGSDAVQKLGGAIKFKQEVAKLLGMKDLSNANAVSDTVEAAKKSGKLTANILTNAYVNMVKGFLREDKIGELTTGLADSTLVGALSNFKSAFDDILIGTDWDQVPGIDKFRQFLVNMTKEIKSSEFKAEIVKLVDTLFGGFGRFDSGTIHRVFTQNIIPAIEQVKKAMEEVWGVFERFVKHGSNSVLKQAVISSSELFILIGKYIGQGIWASLHTDKTTEGQVAAIKARGLGSGVTVHEPMSPQEQKEFWEKEGVKVPESSKSLVRMGGFVVDPSEFEPKKTEVNITINGPANPQEVRKAAQEGVEAAQSKARAERDRIKSGR